MNKKRRIAAVCTVIFVWFAIVNGAVVALGDPGTKLSVNFKGPVKMPIAKYDGERLYKFMKTAPGEKERVKGILKELFPSTSWKAELKTEKGKVGLHLRLEEAISLLDNDSDHKGLLKTLKKDGIVLFCLMPKLNYVQIDGITVKPQKWMRENVEKEYKLPFIKIGQSKETFTEFLRYLSLEVMTAPEKYSPAMSSTPGIRILPSYTGSADKIVYSATYGELLQWDQSTGKVKSLGTKTEQWIKEGNETVYWSPLPPLSISVVPKAYEVTVSYYLNGKIQVEKTLRFDAGDDGLFHVIEIKNDKFQDLY